MSAELTTALESVTAAAYRAAQAGATVEEIRAAVEAGQMEWADMIAAQRRAASFVDKARRAA